MGWGLEGETKLRPFFFSFKKKKAYPCIVKKGFKVQGIILKEDNLVFPSDIVAKHLTTESGEEVGKRN